MALRNWFVYDNITRAQEMTNRIGAFVGLVDNSGFSWGPVYENLSDPENPQYAVESDNTLFQSDHITPRVWTVAAIPGDGGNNPNNVAALEGDPLFTADDLTHHVEVQTSDFVEHDYSQDNQGG
jgi:hypothetical protein